jgi:hypothetical protein
MGQPAPSARARSPPANRTPHPAPHAPPAEGIASEEGPWRRTGVLAEGGLTLPLPASHRDLDITIQTVQEAVQALEGRTIQPSMVTTSTGRPGQLYAPVGGPLLGKHLAEHAGCRSPSHHLSGGPLRPGHR